LRAAKPKELEWVSRQAYVFSLQVSKMHRDCSLNHQLRIFATGGVLSALIACQPSGSKDENSALSKLTSGDSYAMERAKAQRNPYADDFGPPAIDVSDYPTDFQSTYKDVFLVKCQRCHTAARPLNSPYLEPSGLKEEEQKRIARWKKEQPEIFQDRLVWQIGAAEGAKAGIWEQYVKRMMAKPGCNIQPADGRRIWDFLRYDSERRKTGTKAAVWAEHRRKLLANFKSSHPDRYRELYETE
jgi:mono/diheme cytochrome c family protein